MIVSGIIRLTTSTQKLYKRKWPKSGTIYYGQQLFSTSLSFFLSFFSFVFLFLLLWKMLSNIEVFSQLSKSRNGVLGLHHFSREWMKKNEKPRPNSRLVHLLWANGQIVIHHRQNWPEILSKKKLGLLDYQVNYFY